MATIPVTLSNTALPPKIVYDIMHAPDLPFTDYTNLAVSAIKANPPDSQENGLLLVRALMENSYPKVELLFALGVPLVNLGNNGLVSGSCAPTVMSPDFKLSEDLARLYAKTILGMTGGALSIIQKAVRDVPSRLNMFQSISDSAVLARLYIHVHSVSPLPQTNATLVMCARAGLYTKKDETRIRELVSELDKNSANNNSIELQKLTEELTNTKASLSAALQELSDLKNGLALKESVLKQVSAILSKQNE